MFRANLFRSPRRRPLLWLVALSLVVVQGLGVHFHTFADHEPLHDHDHAVELHIGSLSTESGHDSPDKEIGLAQYAILKVKMAHTDGFVLPVVATLFFFGLAPAGRAPWRPGRLFRPSPGSDVRTPPLRAPPRYSF
jgi:hypothetical protein